MTPGTYGNFGYGQIPYGGAFGSTGGIQEDVCGTIVGADLAYKTIEGGMVDYRLTGATTAYVAITGGDEECQ